MTLVLKTLQECGSLNNKAVLLRVDLNVPMHHGRVEDATRIEKLKPTFDYLLDQGAKIIVVSHFGRPKGEFDRDLSLAPIADVLADVLNHEVKFAVDCIGDAAKEAVDGLESGDILLLENVRFHGGEKANDPEFSKELASYADVFVNDTFSCSHRAHASIVGVAEHLPSAAGLLLQEEISSIESVLDNPKTPMTVITGGAKVSTKLALLQNLMKKADHLVIGGAMANTFLKAKGHPIGVSLYEPELVDKAREILEQSKKCDCNIILPSQVVVASKLEQRAENSICDVDDVPNDGMILDIGPMAVQAIEAVLASSSTVVWNGPMGAFEYKPFDAASVAIARSIAYLTGKGKITSLAGGGDVVATIKSSGLAAHFSYISTAGGAFLEWLEGKELPGVAVLVSKEGADAKKVVNS